MIKKLIDNFLSWFHKDDRFLVVEIWRSGLRATPVMANLKARRMKILKPWVAAPGQNITSFVKSLKNLRDYRIILSLESDIATTIYSSVSLVRDKSNAPIDEADLDNIISQAIWKFFDRQRRSAASKMGIEDIDVVLGDVKIWGIRLDGHKVLNPLGFKARSAEVRLSQTLFARQWLSVIENLFPMDSVVLVTESSASFARVVAEATREESFILASLFKTHTSIVEAQEDRIAHFDSFDWGEEHLISGVSAQLAVSPEIARHISLVYNRGEASPLFLRRMSQLFQTECRILENGLQNSIGRIDSKNLYYISFYDVPRVVFRTPIKNKSGRGVKIKPISTESIGQNFGFDIKLKSQNGQNDFFGVAAVMMDAYLVPKNTLINSIAKRRVRWLVDNGGRQ